MVSPQATGLQVSVHGHPNADTLLLWHPAARTGSDAEEVAALASRIANRSGARVLVPRWSGGRDLLRSVRYARESSVHPPDQLSVVGYGDAGIAALSLALHQGRLGIGLTRVTCVDGGADLRDPISGQPLSDPAPGSEPDSTGPVPATAVDVVEGDSPAAAAWASERVEAWRDAGWSATLVPATQFTWRVRPSQ
ncbi:hypothetical protein KG112_17335 [Nocardioides sp. zg-ZUI104]|uniref:hypothetical protein n=1 Tax=Nocardioides faecalis TaxID=2803858 RepID=UPI001BCCD664|nr:hypothetical protein [Nocardioides faecalis]MBS4754574.1 hypothetical protein [Nocardioides faecalis]